MNVASSWTNGYTGKGIVIGIVDDGVHYDHPDLQPNYVSQYQCCIIKRNISSTLVNSFNMNTDNKQNLIIHFIHNKRYFINIVL